MAQIPEWFDRMRSSREVKIDGIRRVSAASTTLNLPTLAVVVAGGTRPDVREADLYGAQVKDTTNRRGLTKYFVVVIHAIDYEADMSKSTKLISKYKHLEVTPGVLPLPVYLANRNCRMFVQFCDNPSMMFSDPNREDIANWFSHPGQETLVYDIPLVPPQPLPTRLLPYLCNSYKTGCRFNQQLYEYNIQAPQGIQSYTPIVRENDGALVPQTYNTGPPDNAVLERKHYKLKPETSNGTNFGKNTVFVGSIALPDFRAAKLDPALGSLRAFINQMQTYCDEADRRARAEMTNIAQHQLYHNEPDSQVPIPGSIKSTGAVAPEVFEVYRRDNQGRLMLNFFTPQYVKILVANTLLNNATDSAFEKDFKERVGPRRQRQINSALNKEVSGIKFHRAIEKQRVEDEKLNLNNAQTLERAYNRMINPPVEQQPAGRGELVGRIPRGVRLPRRGRMAGAWDDLAQNQPGGYIRRDQ